MKSYYKRQMMVMMSIVMLSFMLLSAAFMLLSYRYIISEKRETMRNNVEYISTYTATYYRTSGGIDDDFYRYYMASMALISNSHLVVTDTAGRIIYATDGLTLSGEYTGKQLPEHMLTQAATTGIYTGMSDLDGAYPERMYVATKPVEVSSVLGSMIVGYVMVSSGTNSVWEMWRSTTAIFFFAAVMVFVVASVVCSLTSAYQTRPLNEMAEAARKFGRGEFEIRLRGYERRGDEVGELAEAFNSMANSLEKAEVNRSEFIANVSHELKTPMTSIAGFAEGMLDGTIPPEKQKDALGIIVSETHRLSRLVRKMLELSRLNAATENITAQGQFDLVEVISQVIISLEGKITARNLDLEANLPEDQLMVWGDPDSITQVCYNLMDNAAKFAMEGSTISISVTKKDGKIHTTVRNLGATIPPEDIPLLFDRFHKADYSRSVDRDGVGLGLYIVKTIMGKLKESITVTSEDGVTQFTFTLTPA